MIEVQNEIPSEYTALFAEYVQALKKKCEYVMWVVLTRGRYIAQLEKEQHRRMVEMLLVSGDEQRVRVAEEVMRRSIGTWRER